MTATVAALLSGLYLRGIRALVAYAVMAIAVAGFIRLAYTLRADHPHLIIDRPYFLKGHMVTATFDRATLYPAFTTAVTAVSTADFATQQHIYAYLHVRNEPRRTASTRTARAVLVSIQYSPEGDEPFEIDGRWSDTSMLEPPETYQLPKTFDIEPNGKAHRFDVAALLDDGQLYAMNDEVRPERLRKYPLHSNRVEVKVTARGAGNLKTESLWLLQSDGKNLELTPL